MGGIGVKRVNSVIRRLKLVSVTLDTEVRYSYMFVGAFGSIIFSLLFSQFTNQYNLLTEFGFQLFNFGVFVVPAILHYHKRSNGERGRHSRQVCFGWSFSAVFTVLLYLSNVGLIPLVLQLLG